jgi:hypothetical protein
MIRPVTDRKSKTGPRGDALTAAVLRHIRRAPNRELDLGALAADLGTDPEALQVAVERLHSRRFLIAPFIEPGRAGGAQLTQVGLRWLIDYEGGKPRDTPVALQPATEPVRSADEAARLPRAQVYGVKKPS